VVLHICEAIFEDGLVLIAMKIELLNFRVEVLKVPINQERDLLSYLY
jgi:hypothetical protein